MKENGKRSYLESRLRTSRHRFWARVHETRSICNFKHFQLSLIVLETKINLRHSSSRLSLLLFYVPHCNPTRKCHVGWRRGNVSVYLSLALSLLTTTPKRIIISDILLVKHGYSNVQEVAISLSSWQHSALSWELQL
jgi:hypothetical protein